MNGTSVLKILADIEGKKKGVENLLRIATSVKGLEVGMIIKRKYILYL